MKKWTLLGEESGTGGARGDKRLSLWERDGDYYIRVDGADLMSTRQSTSEVDLGELGATHVVGISNPRVLVGGLGMGFTLKALLAKAPADCRVVVVELSDAIIDWNRNPKYPFAHEALADYRVELISQNVVETISAAVAAYDCILLDVDNGPEALTVASNTRLYDARGLRAIHRALRPGGLVAVWSVDEEPAFERILESAGFRVESRFSYAHQRSGGRRTIVLGHRRT